MEKLGDKAEDFMNKLAELPLDQMIENIRKTLESTRTLMDSPDLRGALAGAHRTAERLPGTVDEARAAIADARRAISTLDGEAQTTAADARETIRAAREALERVHRTMGTLDSTLQGSDDARVASQTMEEIDRPSAPRNVDYIQTHPEAVVLGKPEGGRK
jgi:methyl-accepting chemotaxis protein